MDTKPGTLVSVHRVLDTRYGAYAYLYEVRLCSVGGGPDRISAPVSSPRASEIVTALLAGIAGKGPFAMPPEFNIVGRIE